MKTLYSFSEAQKIMKSIRTNTTFVDWRSKRVYPPQEITLDFCDPCGGLIAHPVKSYVRSIDGRIVCEDCIQCGTDLLRGLVK